MLWAPFLGTDPLLPIVCLDFPHFPGRIIHRHMPKPQKKSSPLLLPMKSPLPYLEKSSFSLSLCVCVCVCVCVCGSNMPNAKLYVPASLWVALSSSQRISSRLSDGFQSINCGFPRNLLFSWLLQLILFSAACGS